MSTNRSQNQLKASRLTDQEKAKSQKLSAGRPPRGKPSAEKLQDDPCGWKGTVEVFRRRHSETWSCGTGQSDWLAFSRETKVPIISQL
ncbi:hypothetical protein NQZ68_032487 [Dissostichus eleginoides]|nr:hypothetical protein NQZ68_032487 [Dissostichus eleginoides]